MFPVLSETFILNQITGLIDRGHEVDIFAAQAERMDTLHTDINKYKLLERMHNKRPIPKNKLWKIIKGLYLASIILRKSPRALLISLDNFKHGRKALALHLLYRILPMIGRKPYDIIHAHFGPNGLLAAKLRQIGAIQGKLVTTFHGYDVNLLPKKYGTDYYTPLFENCDLYTVNTDFTAEIVIGLGCSRNKMVKLPVGLKVIEYAFEPKKRNAGTQVRILTVARLVEKKGIEFSIKAVASLIPNNPDIFYNIVGEGPLRLELEKLIKELGVSKNIKLVGPCKQEEVIRWYSHSQLFILSSVTSSEGDKEGQGLVLQEAQAKGLPVISTFHNGIPEGILNGVSGFLVPERDVDAIVEKLRYLIEHPDIWLKMGRAGRAFVEKRYDIEKLNDRLVEIYKELLNDGRGENMAIQKQ